MGYVLIDLLLLNVMRNKFIFQQYDIRYLLVTLTEKNVYGFINIYIFAELYLYCNKNSECLINKYLDPICYY